MGPVVKNQICKMGLAGLHDLYVFFFGLSTLFWFLVIKSDIGFKQAGCQILTSRMSDFREPNVGF